MANWRTVVVEYEDKNGAEGVVEFETHTTGSTLWAKAYKQAKADTIRKNGVTNAYIVEMAVYNK